MLKSKLSSPGKWIFDSILLFSALRALWLKDTQLACTASASACAKMMLVLFDSQFDNHQGHVLDVFQSKPPLPYPCVCFNKILKTFHIPGHNRAFYYLFRNIPEIPAWLCEHTGFFAVIDPADPSAVFVDPVTFDSYPDLTFFNKKKPARGACLDEAKLLLAGIKMIPPKLTTAFCASGGNFSGQLGVKQFCPDFNNCVTCADSCDYYHGCNRCGANHPALFCDIPFRAFGSVFALDKVFYFSKSDVQTDVLQAGFVTKGIDLTGCPSIDTVVTDFQEAEDLESETAAHEYQRHFYEQLRIVLDEIYETVNEVTADFDDQLAVADPVAPVAAPLDLPVPAPAAAAVPVQPPPPIPPIPDPPPAIPPAPKHAPPAPVPVEPAHAEKEPIPKRSFPPGQFGGGGGAAQERHAQPRFQHPGGAPKYRHDEQQGIS